MTISGSGLGTTSLGAVGGPRGVAAGALRVIIEFVTQYDPKAIAAARADLNKLTTEGGRIQQQLDSKQRASANLGIKLASTEALIRAKLSAKQRQEVQRIINLRDDLNKGDLQRARQAASTLVATSGLIGQQRSQLRTYFSDREKQKKLEAEIGTLQERSKDNTKEQVVAQKQLTRLESVRRGVVPRIAGLVTGAIGGIVGGAVLGVGFAAADAAIQAVGEALQDVLDPARHARDAIKEFGDAINQIASTKGISTLQATDEFLQSIGVHADEATKALIARAAADQQVNENLAEQIKLQEILKHGDAARAQGIKDLMELLRSQGKLPSQTSPVELQAGSVAARQKSKEINDARDLNYVIGEYVQLENDAANAAAIQAQNEANKNLALEQQARNIQILNQLYQAFLQVVGQAADQSFATALGGAQTSRIGKLQDQLDALRGAGGGGGNNAIQNKIDALQKARANQEYADQLHQNSEEREILLLRQRLKLMGENINLEKYSGKFLLEAINAKIAAIQKEGDVQDRVNKLQDIERAAAEADKLTRGAGESIADFIERRAQANQQVLRDRADLARQDRINTLEAERDKVQDQLDLAKNLEDRKKLIADKAYQDQLQRLQDQLKAQQNADNKQLKAKEKAIQDQIDAERKKFQTIEQLSTTSNLQLITDAITAANTLSDLAQLNGAIQGLRQVKGWIQALVDAGLLSPADAATKLAGLDAVLAQDQAKREHLLATPGFNGTNPRNIHPMAQGGVVLLKNSSTTFGSNVRLGEEGSELGVILSHSVVKALRQSQQPSASFGDININGESRNPYGDAYRVKQAVKSALQEML